MKLGQTISQLRNEAKLTQAQFSEIFGVSQQSVQKWEKGTSTPDLEKIVLMSKYFDVSLDALIMGNDNRIVEEMQRSRTVQPQYQNINDWEFYSSGLMIEYQQSIEEGLDLKRYHELFSAVSMLPKNDVKKRLGDILFEIVSSAKQVEGYPYVEPSDLEQIKCLRKGNDEKLPYDKDRLEEKLLGAWMGRICGCLLGKPVEGFRTDKLVPLLQGSNNYPMHRYIVEEDVTNNTKGDFYTMIGKCFADKIDGMPIDDDTNYIVLGQEIIKSYGRDFVPFNVSCAWASFSGKGSFCTAERVSYCNFVNGYAPPESAIYKNPYREWIGAQIRGDYYGYINPGDPALAADMAWRDASISHVKNGIYGEMFASAMLAVAASTDNVEEIVLGGLGQIPYTSRLYEDVMAVYDMYKAGESHQSCFDMIHSKYDEYSSHGWCHTIPNAMIVAAAILYGEGDYGRSICMAVETGFDTDCNGATVGSVVGLAKGIGAIDECWTKPINDTLYTSIFRADKVKISERVKMTLEHIPSK